MKTETTVKAPNAKTLVQRLKDEATTNPCFYAVCSLWAARSRAARDGVVSLAALRSAMHREKYQFSDKHLAEVLQFLAKLGMGVLVMEKGEVKAIQNVQHTLQSIGQAVLGDEALSRYNPGNHYVEIQPVMRPAQIPVATKAKEPQYPARMVIKVNNQDLTFDLPSLTPTELVDLLAKQGFKASTEEKAT